MAAEEARRIAAAQRRRFNELVEVFDAPQPPEVIERLREVVLAAGLRPGEVVLDVGAGVGVLIPLIEPCRPSLILACDLAERMLARLRRKYPAVRVIQADITLSPLRTSTLDAVFMNAMFGNIADKSAACAEAARMLRPGGRLIVSHPEGRSFVDALRNSGDLFIEPLPMKWEFDALLKPFGLEVTAWRDEPKLYLMVARKSHGRQRDRRREAASTGSAELGRAGFPAGPPGA